MRAYPYVRVWKTRDDMISLPEDPERDEIARYAAAKNWTVTPLVRRHRPWKPAQGEAAETMCGELQAATGETWAALSVEDRRAICGLLIRPHPRRPVLQFPLHTE